MIRTSIDYLPPSIQNELGHIARILLEEFDRALAGKRAPHRKAGRILKLILFGAYCRPDWREDDAGTAFDVLAIVNHDDLADIEPYWRPAIDRLYRGLQSTDILRSVRLTVHGLATVNRALGEGVPFFTRIADHGIALYQMTDRPLATSHYLSLEERRERAASAYRAWFPKAADFLAGALFFRDRGNATMAALLLHQTCEQLYRCVLCTFTLHDRRTHALIDLRDLAEQQDERLRGAWPRVTRFERRAFARIRRAYIEARYSATYRIDADELAWAAGQTERLLLLVDRACRDHIHAMRCPTNHLTIRHPTHKRGSIIERGGPIDLLSLPSQRPGNLFRANRLTRDDTVLKRQGRAVPVGLAFVAGIVLASVATAAMDRTAAITDQPESILTIEVAPFTKDDGATPRGQDLDRKPRPPQANKGGEARADHVAVRTRQLTGVTLLQSGGISRSGCRSEFGMSMLGHDGGLT